MDPTSSTFLENLSRLLPLSQLFSEYKSALEKGISSTTLYWNLLISLQNIPDEEMKSIIKDINILIPRTTASTLNYWSKLIKYLDADHVTTLFRISICQPRCFFKTIFSFWLSVKRNFPEKIRFEINTEDTYEKAFTPITNQYI